MQHKTDITSTPLNYQHSKTSTDCTWKGMALFELINCKVQPSQNRPIAYFLEFRQTHIELSSANQGNLTKRKIERPFFILIKWNTINKFATTKKGRKWDVLWHPKQNWRKKEQQENGSNSERQRQFNSWGLQFLNCLSAKTFM